MKIVPFLSVLALLFCFHSCSIPKEPEFKKLQSIQVFSKGKNLFSIKAEAIYHNPNRISTKLKELDIVVFVDDKEVSHIQQELGTVIPAEEEFAIPLAFDFDANEIFKKEDGFLKQALRKLLKEELEVHYKGSMVLTFGDTDIRVPVNYKEDVSFGINFEESN